MIISKTEKAFDKIVHPFLMKNHNKVRIKRNMFNLIKAIYEKYTVNIYLMMKDEMFPLKIRKKLKVSLLTTFIHHCAGGSSWCNKTRKRRGRPIDWKGGQKILYSQTT